MFRPLGTSTNCKHYLALFSTNPIKGTFPQVIAVGEHHNEGEKSLSYRSHLHRIYELMNDLSVWLLSTDYTFLVCLVLYAVHLMAPSFVTSFLHILGCFTLTHQWWQQQEASIPITKIKHTYQYHASRFASIQRTRRKFYFASDHHTQTVIHTCLLKCWSCTSHSFQNY